MILRHLRDTRLSQSSAWSFLVLNWRYIGGGLWWAALFIAAATSTPAGAGSYRWGTPWTFGLAAISITWLLVAPHHRLSRVSAVAVPALAALSRLMDFATGGPWFPHRIALLSWVGYFFIWVAIMPRFLPPPLSNGERYEYRQVRDQ